jgi:hypothetical protein
MFTNVNSFGFRAFMIGLLFLFLGLVYYGIRKLKLYEWIVAGCICLSLSFFFFWITLAYHMPDPVSGRRGGCWSELQDILGVPWADALQPYLSLFFLALSILVGWYGHRHERKRKAST